MYIYLDGDIIYKLNVSTAPKKHGIKMWVFENGDDLDPKETRYCDFKLIATDDNGTILETYFIDNDGNYWHKRKCYFSKILADNERQTRFNKKWLIGSDE